MISSGTFALSSFLRSSWVRLSNWTSQLQLSQVGTTDTHELLLKLLIWTSLYMYPTHDHDNDIAWRCASMFIPASSCAHCTLEEVWRFRGKRMSIGSRDLIVKAECRLLSSQQRLRLIGRNSWRRQIKSVSLSQTNKQINKKATSKWLALGLLMLPLLIAAFGRQTSLRRDRHRATVTRAPSPPLIPEFSKERFYPTTWSSVNFYVRNRGKLIERPISLIYMYFFSNIVTASIS